ncbi:hypothetical protein E5AUHO_08510 [Citrobacter freundii]|nr:hypothetical protein E5AUHO_08510 [Citrobacter freundii]
MNATKKASVAIPAPKILATIASRAKPSTRENIVIELTAASDFNKFIYVVFQTLRQNPDKPARRSDKAFSPPSDTFAVPDGDTLAPYQADKPAYG